MDSLVHVTRQRKQERGSGFRSAQRVDRRFGVIAASLANRFLSLIVVWVSHTRRSLVGDGNARIKSSMRLRAEASVVWQFLIGLSILVPDPARFRGASSGLENSQHQSDVLADRALKR